MTSASRARDFTSAAFCFCITVYRYSVSSVTFSQFTDINIVFLFPNTQLLIWGFAHSHTTHQPLSHTSNHREQLITQIKNWLWFKRIFLKKNPCLQAFPSKILMYMDSMAVILHELWYYCTLIYMSMSHIKVMKNKAWISALWWLIKS